MTTEKKYEVLKEGRMKIDFSCLYSVGDANFLSAKSAKNHAKKLNSNAMMLAALKAALPRLEKMEQEYKRSAERDECCFLGFDEVRQVREAIAQAGE